MNEQSWPTNALIRCVHPTTVIPTKKAPSQFGLPGSMEIHGDISNTPQFIFLKEEGDFRYLRNGKSGMEFKISREQWGNFWVQRVKKENPGIDYGAAVVVENYGDRARVRTEGTETQYIYYWGTGQMQKIPKE